MKEEAKAKAATTKKMNQLAGARLPLPGQDPDCEAGIRAKLIATFEPVDTIEMLWLNDIAYCTATMDVIRAQISGLRMRMIADAYAERSWRLSNSNRGCQTSVAFDAPLRGYRTRR